MNVAFDRGGSGVARVAPADVPGSPERGVLDFASLIEARGLLDGRRSDAMGATRFDEGSLFGEAIAAIRTTPPLVGADVAKKPVAEARIADADVIQEDVAPSPATAANPRMRDRRSALPLGGVPGSHVAALPRVLTQPVASATRPLSLRDHGLSSGRVVAASREDMRARFVDALRPVHVVAHGADDGLHLTIRLAGVPREEVDAVERRLRAEAEEHGRPVSSVRLNGADRAPGMRSSGHG